MGVFIIKIEAYLGCRSINTKFWGAIRMEQRIPPQIHNTVPFNSIRHVTGHRPSRFVAMSHLSYVTAPSDEIIG